MTEEEFLRSYNIGDYERPSVTVDVAAFGVSGEKCESYRKDGNKTISLLLVRRGCHPFKGCWALPGGFLRPGETVEESAFREIKEETGFVPRSLMPIGVFSSSGRDPRGWILSNAFVSIVGEEGVRASGGDDADEARWFRCSLDDEGGGFFGLFLSSGDISLRARLERTAVLFGRSQFRIADGGGLAFDHALIIATAFSILRGVAENFDVLFDFLPEKFTLSSLQKVQESILGVSLQPANFRRKVERFVDETDEFQGGAGHRPAKLFVRKARR